MQFQKFTLKN